MRKNVFGRKFKRDRNERKALFKGLLTSLVINGRVKTTHEKAKAIKSDADKLITKARKEPVLAKRLLERDLMPQAIDKLMVEIAPKFKNRNGGYTRIIKLGNRFSDNASTAILEWVEGEEVILPAKNVAKKEVVKSSKPAKKAKATSAKSAARKKSTPIAKRGGKNDTSKK